ncbi:dihydrolipoamide dehydrogenase [Alteromonas sp. KS69]|nr:dihydrolipoamide dehydrogenase [Rickettsiales bacterium]PHS45398.1 MAG: dihydrolipoamide dehydrogenase [Alteromonas sp.]RUP75853.1 dihydrolipoamide dehydrogenase [Alteromonas sp. KS69]
MSACALVVANADIPALVQSQFERVYLAADIDYFFCADEKEGLAWLASKECKYK